MSVPGTTNKVQYTADGVLDTFAFPYPFFAETDLEVYVDDTLQVLTTDYTVDAISNVFSNGGNVVFVTPPAAASIITISRVIPLTQLTDYEDYSNFPASTFEEDIDRVVMICQQIKEEITRQLHAPASDPLGTSYELPSFADRANTFLAFDAASEPFAAAGASSVPVSTFMETVLDDADRNAACATLGVGIETYNASKTYAEGDLVTYSDIIFRSMAAANTGNTPTDDASLQTYWRQVAPGNRGGTKLLSNADYTITNTEVYDGYAHQTALTADRTLTLPQATYTQSKEIIVMMKAQPTSTYKAIIAASGSDKIGWEGNATTFELYNQGDWVRLRAYSGFWAVVGTNGPKIQYQDTGGGTSIGTPNANQWYSVSSHSITLPAGVWEIGFDAYVDVMDATSVSIQAAAALSTSTSSVSHPHLAAVSGVQGFASGTIAIRTSLSRKAYREALASSTTFYLIIRGVSSGGGTLSTLATDSSVCGTLLLARRVG